MLKNSNMSPGPFWADWFPQGSVELENELLNPLQALLDEALGAEDLDAAVNQDGGSKFYIDIEFDSEYDNQFCHYPVFGFVLLQLPDFCGKPG